MGPIALYSVLSNTIFASWGLTYYPKQYMQTLGPLKSPSFVAMPTLRRRMASNGEAFPQTR